MDINFFKDKKITVLGLGLHGGGVGIVKFLATRGARIVVTDMKSKEELSSSLEKLKGIKNVEYILGQHRNEDFVKTDMVIKNPSVRWDNPHIKLALEKKIPVEMDSGLFFELCKNSIIGITGTKGKTTTAALIFEILKLAGKNPIKVGSGQISVLDKLDALEKDSVVVFELSSWRLSALKKKKLSPHVAVITNILCDHQNYYKSMDDYIADKKNIFLFQKPGDFLIANDESEKIKELYPEIKAEILKFSLKSFGEGKSIFIQDDAIFINDGIDIKKIIDIKDIKIPGKHNLLNVMAAIGAVYPFKARTEEIKKAIINFSGVKHRLEFVREFQGAKYYNDTAATIPDAAMMSLGCFGDPIVLIAGGTDKKLKFADFGKEISQKVKKIILLKGTATEQLLPEIKKNDGGNKLGEIPIVDSMDKAVELASQFSENGDVILLSPGAASFGLFLNEFDRGDKFREAVKNLK